MWLILLSLRKATGTLYQQLQERNKSDIAEADNNILSIVRDKVIAATGSENAVAESAIIKSEVTRGQLTVEEQEVLQTAPVQAAVQVLRESGDLTSVRAASSKAKTNYNDTLSLIYERAQESNLYDSRDDGNTYLVGSDEPVNIRSIASVGDQDVEFKLYEDDTKVSGKDIVFSDLDFATVMSLLPDIQKSVGVKMSNDTANIIMTVVKNGIENGDTTYKGKSEGLLNDVRNIYQDAYFGTGIGELSVLSQKDAQAIARAAKAEAQAASKTPAVKRQSTLGKVTAAKGINLNTIKAKGGIRAVGIKVAEQIAEATGLNIHFFESKQNSEGKWVSEHSKTVNGKQQSSPNGFYQDGKIWIDINAGENGDGLILFTLSHELVHFVKDGSPQDFNALSQFLMDHYGDGIHDNIHWYIQREMRRNHSLKPIEAHEEVIARMCESFLSDMPQHIRDNSAELHKANKGLWGKIRDFLKDFTDRINRYYKGKDLPSDIAYEGRRIAKKYNEVYDLFLQGVQNASDNMRNAETTENTTDEGGVMYDLRGYSEQQVKNWNSSKRIVVYESDTQFAAFISKAKADATYNQKMYFGAITHDLATAIKASTGIDVENYNLSLSAFEIRKIFKSHGSEKAETPRGQRAVTDADIIKIPSVVKGATKISPCGYYNGKPMIEFVKQDNNERYTVRAVVSDKRLDLFVQTSFIGVKKGSLATPTGEQAPINTPEANSGTDSFDNSIRDKSKKSNTSDEKLRKEFSDNNTLFSLREEGPPQNTITGYKVFRVKDGKLYPPMVANPGGQDTPVGVWLNADVGERAPDSKTGRAQVKGKGGMSLSFRPGWHLGDIPRAPQFDRLNPDTGVKDMFPADFVWAECDCAADVDYQDEAMSYGYTDNGKFRHAYAGLPRVPENGYYKYRTNPRPDTVPWIITGAIKVNRILSDAEVADILEKNGVTPPQRQGGNKTLEQLGLNNNHVMNQSRDGDASKQDRYSYDYFISKPDMSIASIDDSITHNRTETVRIAKENAKAFGYVDEEDNPFVHIKDTDTYVKLGSDGLRHSLNRTKGFIYPVTENIGEILSSSIRINELSPKDANAKSTYVLIGTAQSKNGDLYLVRSIVNSYNNELASFDVLYAINTKKELAANKSPRYANNSLSVTNSTISISNLLDYVNRYYPQLLPEDVLKHYGYDARPEGAIGDSALYQSRNGDLFSGDDDLSFGEYDDIADVVKRQYTTHSEAIGEVLKNTADIDIAAGKVKNIVSRLLNARFSGIDQQTKKTLAIRLQAELENAKKAEPQDIVNNMIGAVRDVLNDAKETDDHAVELYNELKAAFDGKYYLTDEQIMDLKENGETLNSFKNAMMGKMTIINKDNAKRSISGGIQGASELSLEGMFDLVEAEEIFGISRDQWDEYGYHAPVMLMDAFKRLKNAQEVPLSKMASSDDMDYIATQIAAEFTGAVVQEKYNSRKNPYVRDLVDRFEARKKEAVKKRNAYYAEKMKEIREQRDRKVAEQIEKNKAARKSETERRKRAECRERIRKLHKNLSDMSLNPKANKYIPDVLMTQSLDVLGAINLDSGFQGERADKFRAKLTALSKTLLERATQFEDEATYDTTVATMLDDLNETIGDTPLGKMTLDQLKRVHDTLKAVQTNIRNRVQIIGDEKTRYIGDIAFKMIDEIDDADLHKVLGSKGAIKMLTAERFFNLICGGAKNNVGKYVIYRMLNDGQLKRIELETWFARMFEDLVSDDQAQALKEKIIS